MSSTVTETAPLAALQSTEETSTITLLTKAGAVKAKLKPHFDKLQALKVLPDELLSTWDKEFRSIELMTKNGQERASDLLCVLLCKMVQPLFLQIADDEVLSALDVIDNAIQTAVLPRTIPSGTTVSEYIEQFQLTHGEKDLLQAKLTLVDEVFQKELGTIYATANKENNHLKEFFNDKKKTLLTQTTDRKSNADTIHAKLLSLSSSVRDVASDLKENVQASSQLLSGVTKQVRAFNQALDECLDMLEKI